MRERKKLANLISIVLGPFWLPFLFLTIIFRSGLNSQQLAILFPSVLLLQVISPLVYLYFAVKLGFATSWDLPIRKERYPFLLTVSTTTLISLFLTHQFGTRLLFDLNLLVIIFLIVLSLITFYWQISLHVALNTFGSILVNFLFGWSLPFLYLTIPLIVWGRLTLTKHTITQLLAGIAVSGLVVIVGLHYFDYLS